MRGDTAHRGNRSVRLQSARDRQRALGKEAIGDDPIAAVDGVEVRAHPRGERALLSFIEVEAIPVLGSGKVDLRRLREIAAERAR